MKYRKIVATAINTLELQEDNFNEKIADPKDIIVKNKYSMISAGTELACIAGIESWFNIPGVPGYTSVGEVLETGSAIDEVKKGDIIYTYGPHSEMYKITAGDRWSGMCAKVPEGIRLPLVPFTRMATIAFTSLRMSNIELGDYVAITGLGPIGNIAAQLAGMQGGNVMAFDISEKRLSIAKACGIQNLVNSKDPDLEEKISDFTAGKGFSTYIDATGLSSVIEGFLKNLSLYGEAILLGSPRAPYQTNLTDTLNRIHLWTHGSITMKGALEFRFPTHETEFVKHSTERNARIIMKLIKEDRLKIDPFFTHQTSPSTAQEMYDGLREKKDEFIGVVFDWSK